MTTTVRLDSARYTRAELDSMRHASITIGQLCGSISPSSLGVWAARRYDQAIAYARDRRGLGTGRVVCGLGFCAGFDSGSDIPAARLIGASQDHVLAFLGGAALRDYVERLKDSGDSDRAERFHEQVREIRQTLQEIRVSLNEREAIQS